MKINFNNKIIDVVGIKECKGLNQVIGLMFSRREKATVLAFSFSKSTKMAIHSFFVFFPFLAVWLDERNKVIEMKKVKPFVFKMSSTKPYYRLLEIPFNKKYKRILKFLSKE